MSIFYCTACKNQLDSDLVNSISLGNKEYCVECFERKFQCEDCGGFENKDAAFAYDGHFCQCADEENNE